MSETRPRRRALGRTGSRNGAPHRVALLCALLLVAAACSRSANPEEPAQPSEPVTDATTMPPPAEVAPLTGLPADPELLERPLLVVKIDNAPKARPPVGINEAEVVYSEKVEDGVTRLFAMFHITDADPIGPVRSARSTDVLLARPLNHPLFAYSGAAESTVELIRQSPMVDLRPDTAAAAFWRDNTRPSPHNLFSSTVELRQPSPESGPPPALFAFRSADEPVDAPDANDAAGAHIEYLGNNIDTIVDYRWDAATETWLRTQDGTPYVDADGRQVAPRNVVIQLVNYRDTGGVDSVGTPIDEAELIGEGEVWVLTDGQVVRGQWRRTGDEVTEYLDADGEPIRLTPGPTWVELAPAGNPNRVE